MRNLGNNWQYVHNLANLRPISRTQKPCHNHRCLCDYDMGFNWKKIIMGQGVNSPVALQS